MVKQPRSGKRFVFPAAEDSVTWKHTSTKFVLTLFSFLLENLVGKQDITGDSSLISLMERLPVG